MAKLLVIDKCCFQGAKESDLIEFVKRNQVLLPHALGIECLTSSDCNGRRPSEAPVHLLQKVETLTKAGAYLGRSFASIRKEEKANRRPVDRIVDENGTRLIRAGRVILTESFVRSEAADCQRAFDPWIACMRDLAHAMVRAMKERSMSAGLQKEIQETGEVERFGKWLQAADQSRIAILQKWIPTLASDVTEHWYTWRIIRLWYGWAMEWAARRSHVDENALRSDVSNDFWDIEYVAHLSVADGLLTKDKRLVEPLARAAFPEKDVFSSLEEVPDSYRCDLGSS